MREGFKGPEYYAKWRADRENRTNQPPVPAAPGRVERAAQPAVNAEAKRAQLGEQIRGIQSRIESERMAAERLRRDGLSWQAQSKDAMVKALEFQIRQLRNDMEKLAA